MMKEKIKNFCKEHEEEIKVGVAVVGFAIGLTAAYIGMEKVFGKVSEKSAERMVEEMIGNPDLGTLGRCLALEQQANHIFYGEPHDMKLGDMGVFGKAILDSELFNTEGMNLDSKVLGALIYME